MNDFVEQTSQERPAFDRTSIQNVEMEQSVLRAILLDREALPKIIAATIEVDDFCKSSHRKIYEAALDLYKRNEPVDMMTVSKALYKRGTFEEVGAEYLGELVSMGPISTNVDICARIIKGKAVVRKLLAVADVDVTRAFEESGDIKVLLNNVERVLAEISRQKDRKTFVPLRGVIMESIKKVETLYNDKQLVTGVPTGYHDLDEKTAGLQPSDLIIIAGRPSTGKTALAMNIAQNMTVINEERVAAIFSLQMSTEQLTLRFLSAQAKVSTQKLRTGYLARSDWPKLTAAVDWLQKANIYIDDSSVQTPLDIRTKASELQTQLGRLDLVVIDSLQLMSSCGRMESGRDVSEITRSLKQLAKEINIPIIAVSQISNTVEDRKGSVPQLSDLREYGSIDDDADVVMFVYRKDVYDENKPELIGRAEIIIGKQRNGPIGSVKLAFLNDFTRFEDMSKVDEELIVAEQVRIMKEGIIRHKDILEELSKR